MPFLADIPSHLQERIVCSISAGVKYEVPANIVLAVAEKEGGRPGQWVRNTNGTHDVGPMQFNTTYLRELERFGITANDVAARGCYAFDLAAWRLRMHLRNDKGDLWTRAANYHSRTPRFNAVYRADLMRKAVKWADWLEARFVTRRHHASRRNPLDNGPAGGSPAGRGTAGSSADDPAGRGAPHDSARLCPPANHLRPQPREQPVVAAKVLRVQMLKCKTISSRHRQSFFLHFWSSIGPGQPLDGLGCNAKAAGRVRNGFVLLPQFRLPRVT
jgi:hypothetical protein